MTEAETRLADDDCSELENDVWAEITDKLIRAERQGFNLVAVAVRETVKATAARVRADTVEECAKAVEALMASSAWATDYKSAYHAGLTEAAAAVRGVSHE